MTPEQRAKFDALISDKPSGWLDKARERRGIALWYDFYNNVDEKIFQGWKQFETDEQAMEYANENDFFYFEKVYVENGERMRLPFTMQID